MANANPAGGSGKTRRQVAKVTPAERATLAQTDGPTKAPVTEAENAAAMEAPKLTPEEQEKLDAPYGRHTDGRPFDNGPKLNPKTQSYEPSIWQEEVESVDQFGNRRTHTIVLEDR